MKWCQNFDKFTKSGDLREFENNELNALQNNPHSYSNSIALSKDNLASSLKGIKYLSPYRVCVKESSSLRI